MDCCSEKKRECSCDKKRSHGDPIHAIAPPNVAGSYAVKDFRGVLGPNAFETSQGLCAATTNSVINIIPAQQSAGCNAGYTINIVTDGGDVTAEAAAVWVYNKANGWHLILSSIEDNVFVETPGIEFFFDRIAGSGAIYFDYVKRSSRSRHSSYKLSKINFHIAFQVELEVEIDEEDFFFISDNLAVSGVGTPLAVQLPPTAPRRGVATRRAAGRAKKPHHVASREEARQLFAKSERALLARFQ